MQETPNIEKNNVLFLWEFDQDHQNSTKMWVFDKFALEEVVNLQSRTRGMAVLFLLLWH
jgi:hypothetical protein